MTYQNEPQVNVANVLNAFCLDWDYCEDQRYLIVDLSNSITVDGRNAVDGWHEVAVDMLEGALSYAIESTTISQVISWASETGNVGEFDDDDVNGSGVYLVACLDVMAEILRTKTYRHEDGSYSMKQELH
jgi:hypothetical protein